MFELSEFFAPEPLLWRANGTLYEPFDGSHLAMLVSCLASVALLLWAYRRADDPTRLRMLRAMGTLPVALLASRDVVLAARGLFEPQFWPLHICNFCELVVLAYVWLPQGAARDRLGSLAFFWALPGGVGALLLPGWRYCPLWSYASLGGYAEHLLLLAVVLCALQGGQLEPRREDLPLSVALALLGGAAFRLLNPAWGTNFFFVTNASAVGGPYAVLHDLLGDPAWLVGYLASVIVLWHGEWALWHAWRRAWPHDRDHGNPAPQPGTTGADGGDGRATSPRLRIVGEEPPSPESGRPRAAQASSAARGHVRTYHRRRTTARKGPAPCSRSTRSTMRATSCATSPAAPTSSPLRRSPPAWTCT